MNNGRGRRLVAGIGAVALSAAAGVGSSCSDEGSPRLSGAAERGRLLAAERGCAACHSTDGSTLVGPTWKGIWGENVVLSDGRSVAFDADYVRESLRAPNAARRKGVMAAMPAFDTQRVSDAEIADLVAYINALSPST